MTNLKKILLFSLLVTVSVSPLITKVNATDGQWQPTVSSATWEYDLYRVERLSFGGKAVQGPFKQGDGVFVTQQAKSCVKASTCKQVDLTLLKNGSALPVSSLSSYGAQDNRFVYFIPSTDKNFWGTVYEYLPETGLIQTLASIERKANELNFEASAVDGSRIYTSILHKEEKTGAVKSKLSMFDYKSTLRFDDFTWNLNVPWQEVADVRNGVVLAKFQFDGGNKQLALVDTATRKVQEIPGTWTEPPGDLVNAHFLSDGSIQYFQNFRLYSFNPTVDTKPKEHGGATLNWFVDAKSAAKVVGDRMAYVSSDNTLYVSDTNGVANFGKALNGRFALSADTISYQSMDGYISYTFSTKNWKNLHYRVTDTFEDISVGIDGKGDIWYENATSGKTVNMGFGSEPMLTDREHAVWKGADGNVYEATFSSLLDLGTASVKAVKALNTNAVYIINGSQMWKIPDPTTYFTWFHSWSEVTTVSPQTLKAYMDKSTFMGDALFAPGTRVKSMADTRVYVIGTDRQLHWIISETVADSIYGSAWNRGIIEVRPERLWNYQTGGNIQSNKDIQVI